MFTASLSPPRLQVGPGGARAPDLRRAHREEEQQRDRGGRGEAQEVHPDLEVWPRMSLNSASYCCFSSIVFRTVEPPAAGSAAKGEKSKLRKRLSFQHSSAAGSFKRKVGNSLGNMPGIKSPAIPGRPLGTSSFVQES